VTDLGVTIDALLDEARFPAVDLHPEVEAAYGGPLGLPEDVVYANFVASIDGVAAISGITTSSALISGGGAADRFVMALLRSAADAVIVGSGTLREHDGPWTAEHAFPRGAQQFERSGSDRSASSEPQLVVTTRRGDLRIDHPALAGSLVASTTRGARSVADRGAGRLEVLDLGDTDEIDPRALVVALRERGHRRILTEGGPRWMGSMLAAAAVDQLFLTVAPSMLGGGSGRVPLSGERDLRTTDHDARLIGVRTSADYLFVRYALGER